MARTIRRRNHRGSSSPRDPPEGPERDTESQDPQEPPPTKLPYGTKLKIVSFNAQGLKDPVKRITLARDLEEAQADIAFLQETHVSESEQQQNSGYTWFFSSEITYATKAEAEVERAKPKPKARRKAKAKAEAAPQEGEQPPAHGIPAQGNEDRRRQILQNAREHAGVAVVIKNKLVKYVANILPISSRNIMLELEVQGVNIIILGTHAPQAGQTTAQKHKHYQQIHDIISKTPHQPTYCVGDFNVRLGRARAGETNTVGPYSWVPENPESAEDEAGQQHGEGVEENREFFLKLCAENDLLPINTWRCKCPEKHPPTKDQAAPGPLPSHPTRRN